MAIRVALHHRTVYKYDRLVTLSPQIVRLIGLGIHRLGTRSAGDTSADAGSAASQNVCPKSGKAFVARLHHTRQDDQATSEDAIASP